MKITIEADTAATVKITLDWDGERYDETWVRNATGCNTTDKGIAAKIEERYSDMMDDNDENDDNDEYEVQKKYVDKVLSLVGMIDALPSMKIMEILEAWE